MKRLPSPPPPLVRRGISLIELMITMIVSGVVLTMGIGLLHLLLQTDDNLHHSLKRRQTVTQLSDAFRRDIHAARQVRWNEPQNDEEAKSLTVQLTPSHAVEYTTKAHTLIRTETQNQEMLQTARFRFSPGTEISLESSTENTIAVVIRSDNTTTDSPRTTDPRVPKRELRIQATTGRDHRFEKTATP